MLLQSIDFFELHRQHGCTLQFGGSDQWGNITAGVDCPPARRRAGARVRHAAGHQGRRHQVRQDRGRRLWLDPEMTSPYAFYQFWLNADDRDVGRYLRYFSFRSREEIEALEKADRRAAGGPAGPAGTGRRAHHAGARRRRRRRQAIAASQALFGRGSLAELAPATLRAALAEAGLVRSRRAARRGRRCSGSPGWWRA